MRAVGDSLAGGHRHLLPHLGIWVQTSALRGDLQSRNSRIRRVQFISTLKAELCVHFSLIKHFKQTEEANVDNSLTAHLYLNGSECD